MNQLTTAEDFWNALRRQRDWIHLYARAAHWLALLLGAAVLYVILGSLYRIAFDPPPARAISRAGFFNDWYLLLSLIRPLIAAVLVLMVARFLDFISGKDDSPSWMARALPMLLLAGALFAAFLAVSAFTATPYALYQHARQAPGVSFGELPVVYTVLAQGLTSLSAALGQFALARLARRALDVVEEMKHVI